MVEEPRRSSHREHLHGVRAVDRQHRVAERLKLPVHAVGRHGIGRRARHIVQRRGAFLVQLLVRAEERVDVARQVLGGIRTLHDVISGGRIRHRSREGTVGLHVGNAVLGLFQLAVEKVGLIRLQTAEQYARHLSGTVLHCIAPIRARVRRGKKVNAIGAGNRSRHATWNR